MTISSGLFQENWEFAQIVPIGQRFGIEITFSNEEKILVGQSFSSPVEAKEQIQKTRAAIHAQ